MIAISKQFTSSKISLLQTNCEHKSLGTKVQFYMLGPITDRTYTTSILTINLIYPCRNCVVYQVTQKNWLAGDFKAPYIDWNTICCHPYITH